MADKFRIALCQMLVEEEKGVNLAKAARFVIEAARNNAKIVCLPEIWNSPYDPKRFAENAERENGKTVAFMSELARGEGVYLIGGSIPELDGEKVYNTSYVFNQAGELIAKNRKTHLFDVDVEGGVRFKESDSFAPGDGPTVFDTEYGKVGLAICFDVRFPEMIAQMWEQGAGVVFLPAQFSMSTGSVHWELLMRSRALDYQVFFAACAAARNYNASFKAWGHSMIVNPYGAVCGKADERESIVYGEIDPEYTRSIRKQIPIGR